MDFSILLPNEFFTERVFYFVIAFSSLTVLILVLILLYVFQSKKQAKDRLMENEIKDKAYVEAMKIMDSARLKSLKILEESQLKAHKSLDNASSLSKEARAELDRKFAVIYDKQTSTLDGLSQELVKTYKDALEKERKENMQVIDETSDMLKRELTAEVIEITDTVRKGTIEKQKEIEKKLEEEYSRVEEEINAYKAQKTEEINSRIFDIIARVSDRVLGRVIDQSSHEKFILDTLTEELMKQGFSAKK
ncbi:MAG: hypothetical protein UU64_C0013G0014 [candidate division WWE3 bacterium GW2011_GWF2_41_45]|uniref:Uncharacterized protein n=3 Tax=Katanobacteria TaxID=422282 RepID=A0A1F4W3P5_UNCKA|nr:MAG: hypothetical protein UU55_C0014G0014 [candidate division WWE3 bacterium GW2011_GWC2_41_23]KKS09948.1 MAG: hypothetical protein UU64_C0013G0014 [candidate division WWE3 bacterium GW2011_GWF2_41_45]KKS11925.1 MAG: hypothetical protein UU68_C0008G0014 [candidate division WWE3 bacterium GW2011_GWF1_41_53]KKS19594.1 MAG: hypothetical protein UU79_C0015G0014 [candidate division WWE3 bacterium GW2011_GWE1_41_72]KKS28127.1 MAG: hypothetical protein UU86_C0011G0014 [candidate division WWE3 bacte